MLFRPDRLTERRKHARLTQEQLAIKVNLTKAAISNYEQGRSAPPHETLVSIVDALDTNSDYLLGISENPSRDLASQLISAENKAKHGESAIEESADYEKNIGRAFLGGADKYTEEELDLARAAAKAAVDAYRKGQRKRDENNS